ncbi:MAG: ATP-binding protein [Pseudobdellovibrionaceae bacterium]
MKKLKLFLQKINTTKSRVIFRHLIRAVLAGVISILVMQFKLDFAEFFFYDLKLRYRNQPEVSKNIELVFINSNTLQYLKSAPGYKEQSDFLQKLIEENPKAVVYDFNMENIKGSLTEKQQWLDKTKLLDNFFVALKAPEIASEDKKTKSIFPLDSVSLVPAPKTADISNFAKDGVSRRMMLDYQGQIMLQPYLASLYNPDILDLKNIVGLFNFFDTHQAMIDFAKESTYPKIDFHDLMLGQFVKGRFKDKIVLIGEDLGISEEDYLLSPFRRDVTGMTRIEMQANIIDTLIRNSAPQKADSFWNHWIIFLISLATIYIVLSLKPVKGLIALIATFLGYLLFSYLVFVFTRIQLATAAPLLSVFICYYFFIPYRLILEHRRSWEYYEKNKLLRQVEQLKTNFISMMSHDLKTPIARILGMTDIVTRDHSVTLSSKQREALDTIKNSGEDLLKFINTILDYGRIESEGVQIRRQSRDVNSLLSDVIKKHEFLAKIKHIKIKSELEPLFPLSIDPDLIKQVFSNLLENAIKYSPDNSNITVSTAEKEGYVVAQFVDSGHGIPEDELQNIFMKFFRSKSVKTSPIKGTGLGLYLSKYFTELHGGSIFVESTYGQGSIFKVELPIDSRGKDA